MLFYNPSFACHSYDFNNIKFCESKFHSAEDLKTEI